MRGYKERHCCNYEACCLDMAVISPRQGKLTCLDLPVTFLGMDGDEIRRAREARGWTQQQLAQAVGVGPRTVGNWERGATVPKNRMGKLRQVFAVEPDQSGDPIRTASEVTLLAELMRRAAAREAGQ